MILRDYHEEIEADLADQGIDLSAFWRGEMTTRRLWTLLLQMRPDTRFKWAITNDHEPPEPEVDPAVEQRHAALEAQFQRNRERGLIL